MKGIDNMKDFKLQTLEMINDSIGALEDELIEEITVLTALVKEVEESEKDLIYKKITFLYSHVQKLKRTRASYGELALKVNLS